MRFFSVRAGRRAIAITVGVAAASPVLARAVASPSAPKAIEHVAAPVAAPVVLHLSAQDDTARVHRELRSRIEQFQDAWRKAWQKAEIKRHKPVDLNKIRGWMVTWNGTIEPPTWDGDRTADNLTADLRRYLAILCFVDTPTDRQIEAVKARTAMNIGTPVARPRQGEIMSERTQRRVRGESPRAPTTPWVEPPQARSVTATLSAGVGGVSFATRNIIQGSPNSGPVCPAWTPPDQRLALDEGESIDLAFPAAGREAVRNEREKLIRDLEAAHTRFPSDDWITGQFVRFVLDQRAPERSVAAARTCQGAGSWCAALLGLALEQAADIPAAEAAFRMADSVTRTAAAGRGVCVDEETLLLFDGKAREALTRNSCETQRTLVERMWWLADPLWSVPGNERFVAHGSRRTHATLRAVLPRDERYVWDKRGGGSAIREMVVRYGWPAYTYWPGGQFEEEMNKLREAGIGTRAAGFVYPPYTAKEYSADRTATIPSMQAISDPFRATPSHWTMHAPDKASAQTWWPQEHMMLRTDVESLGLGQQVQWRRDSMLVFALAVGDALRNRDTSATAVAAKALLMGSTGPGSFRAISATSVSNGQTLRLRGEIAAAPIVLSAELHARSGREASRRYRFGMQPSQPLREMEAGSVALSDPVFMRLPSRNSEVPTDMETVTALMAGDLTFARTEPLALYWESYGFPTGDTLQLGLRVVRDDDVGIARRIGAAVGLSSDLRDSIVIRWTAPDSRQGTAIATASKSAVGRALALDINALPEGDYVVAIEVRRGSTFARSERKFVVKER